MGISLHTAIVPSFIQMLGALSGLLDKAEAFAADKGVPADSLIEARLIDDMLPFAYQVKSAVVHSLGAIEGVRQGLFAPDMTPPPASFAALRQRVQEGRDALAALDPAELDSYVGRDMRFEIGEFRLDFTAENFLLGFSQPNFYFHVTTAYDILRMKGVPIGKLDFMGAMPVRR